ncbi:hypothetical protein EGW08_021793, partial [Elysia chlorotica]
RFTSEVTLKNERDDLRIKYYDAKAECLDEHIKYTDERLARSMQEVAVPRRSQAETQEMLDLRTENTALKRELLELQQKKEEEAAALLEKYKREVGKRKALHNALVELRGNIRVYLRPKPLTE